MKSELKIKSRMDAKNLVGILEDLVNSFRQGTICLERGEEFVTLKPGNHFDVELEAGIKKNKQKLSIELSWLTAACDGEGEVEFKISDQEPEMKAPVEETEEKEEEPPSE